MNVSSSQSLPILQYSALDISLKSTEVEAEETVPAPDAVAAGEGADGVKESSPDPDFSTKKLKFLACGTLGIDLEEDTAEQDAYYRVGQYLKAAGTVGGMIALFI